MPGTVAIEDTSSPLRTPALPFPLGELSLDIATADEPRNTLALDDAEETTLL
jgi:hypothetical protein